MTVAKTSLPQSVSTTIEALLHSDGTKYVKGCLHNRCLHAKLHWKPSSYTEVTAKLIALAWTAMSKFIGLGSFQTVYWLYFVYESRFALLHV